MKWQWQLPQNVQYLFKNSLAHPAKTEIPTVGTFGTVSGSSVTASMDENARRDASQGWEVGLFSDLDSSSPGFASARSFKSSNLLVSWVSPAENFKCCTIPTK